MIDQNTEIRPITKFGRERRGTTKNDTIRDAVPLINDIFACSIEEGLDLFIVCRHVDGTKDKIFREMLEGIGFTDLIKAALAHGRNVTLLIWSKDAGVLNTEEFAELRRYASDVGVTGKLEMRISRSEDPRFGHFIVAVNHQTDRWIVRLEKPHKAIEPRLDFPVPAAVIFDSDRAREFGRQALHQFAAYFGRSASIPEEYFGSLPPDSNHGSSYLG